MIFPWEGVLCGSVVSGISISVCLFIGRVLSFSVVVSVPVLPEPQAQNESMTKPARNKEKSFFIDFFSLTFPATSI